VELEPVAHHQHDSVTRSDAEGRETAGEPGRPIGVLRPRHLLAVQLPNGDVVRLPGNGAGESFEDIPGRVCHAVNRTTQNAPVTSEVWTARYPDLRGKVALVAGDGPALVAIVTTLAANGTPICVVANDRSVVDAAVAAAEANGAMGVTSGPDDVATWTRVLPHAEQRLGPLDIVVAAGAAAGRESVISAVLPDMGARRRGVVVEVGDDAEAAQATPGVRRRSIIVDATTGVDDVAAVVALCVSDVLTASAATIRLVD
jgi:hypothetical protein